MGGSGVQGGVRAWAKRSSGFQEGGRGRGLWTIASQVGKDGGQVTRCSWLQHLSPASHGLRGKGGRAWSLRPPGYGSGMAPSTIARLEGWGEAPESPYRVVCTCTENLSWARKFLTHGAMAPLEGSGTSTPLCRCSDRLEVLPWLLPTSPAPELWPV